MVVDRDEHPRAYATAEALTSCDQPSRRRGGRDRRQQLRHQRRGQGRPRRRRDVARDPGLKPMARGVSTAVAGVDPGAMETA